MFSDRRIIIISRLRLLQIVLKNLIKYFIDSGNFPWFLNWLIKLTSCVASTGIAAHVVSVNVTVIHLMVIFFEGIAITSTKDLFPKTTKTIGNHHCFMLCLKKFKHVQIVMLNLDQLLFWYFAVLAKMGILATSASGFVAVTYSSYEIPIIHFFACVAFGVGIFLDFFLINFAAIPNIYSIKFKHYWKGRAVRRISQMNINSCPSIGFTVGVIKKVKRRTKLSIADTMLGFMATMVLTKCNV